MSNKKSIKEETVLLSSAIKATDVDMEYSDSNNNNTQQNSEIGFRSADRITNGLTTANSVNNNKHSKQSNITSECDFKDVILCNLIDDFLLKENEF